MTFSIIARDPGTGRTHGRDDERLPWARGCSPGAPGWAASSRSATDPSGPRASTCSPPGAARERPSTLVASAVCAPARQPPSWTPPGRPPWPTATRRPRRLLAAGDSVAVIGNVPRLARGGPGISTPISRTRAPTSRPGSLALRGEDGEERPARLRPAGLRRAPVLSRRPPRGPRAADPLAELVALNEAFTPRRNDYVRRAIGPDVSYAFPEVPVTEAPARLRRTDPRPRRWAPASSACSSGWASRSLSPRLAQPRDLRRPRRLGHPPGDPGTSRAGSPPTATRGDRQARRARDDHGQASSMPRRRWRPPTPTQCRSSRSRPASASPTRARSSAGCTRAGPAREHRGLVTSIRCRSEAQAAAVLENLASWATGRPRPVHLEVPIEVLAPALEELPRATASSPPRPTPRRSPRPRSSRPQIPRRRRGGKRSRRPRRAQRRRARPRRPC